MVTSILHRITGAALAVGMILLVIWLLTLAFCPENYEQLSECLRSPFGLVVLIGFTLAFNYHFINGIRHLIWDAGIGLKVSTINITGPLVIIGAIALTAITWGMVL